MLSPISSRTRVIAALVTALLLSSLASLPAQGRPSSPPPTESQVKAAPAKATPTTAKVAKHKVVKHKLVKATVTVRNVTRGKLTKGKVTKRKVTRKSVKAAAASPADYSTSLPRTIRDEITGDFMGLGYDQRIRAEGSALNTYNPPALGGGLLQSTPMDLAPPTGANLWIHNQVGHIEAFAQYSQRGTINCLRCFQAIDSVYHLGSIYLAQVNGSIYISGTKGVSIDGGSNDNFPEDGSAVYRNVVYRVSGDGKCATEGCAYNVVDLPTYLDPGFPDDARAVGVTALAAGLSGNQAFVAVGLTDYGVRVYKSDLSTYGQYSDMSTNDGSQTPTSTLAFDPSGSGMLAVGVVSIGKNSLTVQVNPDGTVTGTQGYLALAGGDRARPAPLSALRDLRPSAGSRGADVVAFGYNEAIVRLGDPRQINAQELAQGSGLAGISVVNAVPRTDNSGYDDYAVASVAEHGGRDRPDGGPADVLEAEHG